jgi:hypothetical protein
MIALQEAFEHLIAKKAILNVEGDWRIKTISLLYHEHDITAHADHPVACPDGFAVVSFRSSVANLPYTLEFCERGDNRSHRLSSKVLLSCFIHYVHTPFFDSQRDQRSSRCVINISDFQD